MSEEEKRLHRCCFTGHRPEKLKEPEEEIKSWLEKQIDRAIEDGFTTFISGCAMGVDLWAARIVTCRKMYYPNLHLIAATPWPGFAARWKGEWKDRYDSLMYEADLVVNVCDHYHAGVFQQRNEWMVNHSNRLIGYYNGTPGGTKNTIDYTRKKMIDIVVWQDEETLYSDFCR